MSKQQLEKVKVKRLAHVGLWATDIPAQIRFYRQVLGFDLRAMTNNTSETDSDEGQEESSAFLALGDEHHCLGLFSDTRDTHDTRPSVSNGRTSVPASHLHHLSFEVDTDAELAALAARLSMNGIELSLEPRDGNAELGDTLWFDDPDGNRIEISVTPDDALAPTPTLTTGRRTRFRPHGLQNIAIQTPNLEGMVEFYTESLGFDISDWLLRECVWLRCNHDHHTLMLIQGKHDIDHIGYSISDGPEILTWADHLSRHHTPIIWGPGRHGAGDDLFLRFTDGDGIPVELSAELQQFYDHDVTTPPRLWHSKDMALNLWGNTPTGMHS